MSGDGSPDYKATLNLPVTAFPMRANLPAREPEILARWEREGLYQQTLAARAGRPRYVLHDGPPYANGNIHLGHALNKIVKDVIVKFKGMSGFLAPYVPGLGLPWTADRAAGGEEPREGAQSRAREARDPATVSRVRHALRRGSTRGVQASRRDRRLGGAVPDHGSAVRCDRGA